MVIIYPKLLTFFRTSGSLWFFFWVKATYFEPTWNRKSYKITIQQSSPSLRPIYFEILTFILFLQNVDLNSYKAWVKERKQLRKDLNQCGLVYDWLESKPSLTEIEQRVQDAQPITSNRNSRSTRMRVNSDCQWTIHVRKIFDLGEKTKFPARTF